MKKTADNSVDADISHSIANKTESVHDHKKCTLSSGYSDTDCETVDNEYTSYATKMRYS